MKFFLRLFGIFVAVLVTVYLLPGLSIVPGDSLFISLLVMSLIIAFLNATLKPLLQTLGLPLTVISLGVFYLIINACLLYLGAAIGNALFDAGFYIATFADAFVGSILISIVSGIMNALTGAKED